MKVLKEIWEVEMWKNIGTIETPIMEWVKEKRYYETAKSKSDFDLYDVPGLRKNAKFVGFQSPLKRLK